MSRPYRLAIFTAAFICFIDIVIWFFAQSPRARLNITQFVSVLFFAILAYRFAKVQPKPDEAAHSPAHPSDESILLPAIAVLTGIIVWTRMLPYYFISDDFGLLYMSRTPIPDLM